jgi:hypothetical protein
MQTGADCPVEDDHNLRRKLSYQLKIDLARFTAMMVCPTAIAGKACFHDNPTANIELASCQLEMAVASETQYAT